MKAEKILYNNHNNNDCGFCDVVDLKLEGKWELVLTQYHCHGSGSISRSDDLEVNALQLC